MDKTVPMETGNPSSNPDPAPQPIANKRQILVDPVTGDELPDPKRPKVKMEEDKKARVLKAIISGYDNFMVLFIPDAENKGKALHDVSVSHQITSVIFTCHNVSRQEANGTVGNMATKSKSTSFKVNFLGFKHPGTTPTALKMWKECCSDAGLIYKKFELKDDTNWYGTMGSYLDFFGAFGLRMTELRIGHGTMPIGKVDGVLKAFPVSKYRLYGARHILLEGCTFPPERRSSIAQSLGPMTSLLCMMRSEGKYKSKWTNAVKRSMAHIPGIDDIIKVLNDSKSRK